MEDLPGSRCKHREVRRASEWEQEVSGCKVEKGERVWKQHINRTDSPTARGRGGGTSEESPGSHWKEGEVSGRKVDNGERG